MSTRRIVIDNCPGAIIEWTGENQRLDITLTTFQRTYCALHNNYLFMLGVYVVQRPHEETEDFESRIKRLDPLFRFIANSITIQNQYY